MDRLKDIELSVFSEKIFLLSLALYALTLGKGSNRKVRS